MKKVIGLILCLLALCVCAVALADLEINADNFPDLVFREYLKRFDTDESGGFSDAEIQEIQEISIVDKQLSDLTGIDYLTKIRVLECEKNNLKKLDLTNNTDLYVLICGYNQLTELKLPNNTNLYSLDCRYNQLTELDVSHNPSFTNLICYSNQLKKLDCGNQSKLQVLACGENQLTELILSPQLTSLTEFDCDHNMLTTIDVSVYPDLTELRCNSNQLTELDVTHNSYLTVLNCGDNDISSLDVTKNSLLESIDCRIGRLASLDLSKCPKLKRINCGSNQLKELIISDSTILTSLSCNGNQLSELDLSGFPNLKTASVEDNCFTTLDITACPELCAVVRDFDRKRVYGNDDMFFSPYVDSYGTLCVDRYVTITAGDFVSKPLIPITKDAAEFYDDPVVFEDPFLSAEIVHGDLDGDGFLNFREISRITTIICSDCDLTSLAGIEMLTELDTLYVHHNRYLTKLDVSKLKKLKKLECSYCQLESLDVSQNSELQELSCGGNPLTLLDISHNSKLKSLICEGSQLTTLDLSHNQELKGLRLDGNPLTSLDVSQCPAFCELVKTTSPGLLFGQPSAYGWYDPETGTSLQIDMGLPVTPKGPIHIASISFNPDEWYTWLWGDSSMNQEEMKPIILPENADDRSVTWSSSDPTIVAVDENGIVTFLKLGEAVITCTAKDGGGAKGECRITTRPVKVEGIGLDLATFGLTLTRTFQVPQPTAHVNGWTVPANATNNTVSWSSSDLSVATVDQDGNVTGLKKGKATITCSANDGSGVSAEFEVNVEDLLLTCIVVNKTQATLDLTDQHSTVQLTATLDYPDALDKLVVWTSSDAEIASVDENGLVTAHKTGSATIICKSTEYAGPQAFCEITVVENLPPEGETPPPEGETPPPEGETPPPEGETPPAEGENPPAEGENPPPEGENPPPEGEIPPAEGEELPPQEDIIYVSAIRLDKTNAVLTIKSETPNPVLQLTATIEPADATDPSVSWLSSNTEIASVDGNGLVTACKAGSAVIICRANDGSGIESHCEITVEERNPQLVSQIQLNKNKATLTRTSKETKPTLQLKVKTDPADADNASVEWSSSNPKIAKVDQNGKVTALKNGKAIISCKTKDGGGATDTCEITVKDKKLSKLTLNKTKATMKKGKTLQLKAKNFKPANAFNKKVKWTTSNKKIATVDKNGKVKAKGSGTCYIICTAQDGSKVKAKCKITVK